MGKLETIQAHVDILKANAEKFALAHKDTPWTNGTSSDILYQLFMQDAFFLDMLDGILKEDELYEETTTGADDIIYDALCEAFEAIGRDDVATRLKDIQENGL